MTRPYYETEQDLQNERDVAKIIEEVHNCKLIKMPIKLSLDFMAVRDGKAGGVIQARPRQKIIEKNLPKTIDGRARPMRLLPHRMSLPTGKAPIDPPPPSRGSQKIQLEKPLKNGDTRETKIYLSTLFL